MHERERSSRNGREGTKKKHRARTFVEREVASAAHTHGRVVVFVGDHCAPARALVAVDLTARTAVVAPHQQTERFVARLANGGAATTQRTKNEQIRECAQTIQMQRRNVQTVGLPIFGHITLDRRHTALAIEL